MSGHGGVRVKAGRKPKAVIAEGIKKGREKGVEIKKRAKNPDPNLRTWPLFDPPTPLAVGSLLSSIAPLPTLSSAVSKHSASPSAANANNAARPRQKRTSATAASAAAADEADDGMVETGVIPSLGLEDEAGHAVDPPDEKRVDGVQWEWLQRVLAQVQAQLNPAPPAKPSLDCYDAGSYFIRPPNPTFACRRSASLSPEPFYLRPVMVWIPHMLDGVGRLSCPNCPASNVKLSRHCFNPNIARRIRDVNGDFYLLTCRYRHGTGGTNGCGATFQGYDEGIMAMLPEEYQIDFGIILTARGGATTTLVNQLQAGVAGHFGLAKFAEMLNENRRLQHSEREYQYLSINLARRNTNTLTNYTEFTPDDGELPLDEPEPFSPYLDRNGYAGKKVSSHWLIAVLKAYDLAYGPLMDRCIFAVSGTVLGGDASYKAPKRMAAMDGKPGGQGLHTFVNQDGEIRQMQLVQSKSNAAIKPMLQGIVQGLEEHGHPKIELVYSDFANGEARLLEQCIPDLLNGVTHIRPPSKYDNLPEYDLHIPPLYTDSYETINDECSDIIALADAKSQGEQTYVGFDLEWKTGRNAQGGVTSKKGDNRVDVIQVSTGKKVLVFQVTKYQDINTAPPNLISLLQSNRVTKLGVGVKKDLERITKLWGLAPLRERLTTKSQTDYLELGALAFLKGRVTNKGCSLQDIAAAVLDRHLPKSEVRVSDWSMRPLDAEQLDYAAKDAHISSELFERLSIMPDVGGPVTLSTPSQTLVDILGGKTGIVARGHMADRAAFAQSPAISSASRNNKSLGFVTVTDVLVPGFEVSSGKNAKHPLSAYGPPPFLIVVPLASVRWLSLEDL